jgi:myosin heavy subunit
MDCHESVQSRGGGFQFDAYSNVDDDDLCRLPDLNEQTLLEKLFQRFERGKIYTYVGEILIAVNPYKFFPIYNPKYINAYQNKRLGDLQPHIFAIADEAFQNMLKERKDQCVVISGESGSGKTESTKLLLHHLTALSHKAGFENTSVEKTILGAGPVLEVRIFASFVVLISFPVLIHHKLHFPEAIITPSMYRLVALNTWLFFC